MNNVLPVEEGQAVQDLEEEGGGGGRNKIENKEKASSRKAASARNDANSTRKLAKDFPNLSHVDAHQMFRKGAEAAQELGQRAVLHKLEHNVHHRSLPVETVVSTGSGRS